MEKDRLLSAKTTTEACLIEKELIFKQKRNVMLLELRKQKEQWDQGKRAKISNHNTFDHTVRPVSTIGNH